MELYFLMAMKSAKQLICPGSITKEEFPAFPKELTASENGSVLNSDGIWK